jgi:hypothetical protein
MDLPTPPRTSLAAHTSSPSSILLYLELLPIGNCVNALLAKEAAEDQLLKKKAC